MFLEKHWTPWSGNMINFALQSSLLLTTKITLYKIPLRIVAVLSLLTLRCE